LQLVVVGRYPRTAIASVAGLACLAIGAGVPGRVSAQTPLRGPAVAVGMTFQERPIAEYGYTGRLGLQFAFSRHIFLTPSLDAARWHNGGQDSCLPIGNDQCLSRPRTEHLIAGALAVGVRARGTFYPYLEAGAALVRSLASDNPGERGQFVVPEAEIGVRRAGSNGRWSVSARWRRIGRWPTLDPVNQWAVLFGFIPGGSS